MGKGDVPRPFSNYNQYIENWDKIFKSQEVTNHNTCHHKISIQSMICEFCGKDQGEIYKDGDSHYMTN